MADRPYDVVLFGATGFAGRLVAEYLHDHHGGALRWAIAGRSQAKLDEVADALAARRPELDPVPTVVADSTDADTLAAMARSTRVVCSTVGPYARYGAPLVAACVAEGAHYCDLTGEPQFVRRMIDAHHDAASAAGLHIVHCCGFDSIPSDLGTLFLQTTAIERDGTPCDEVEFVMLVLEGGYSGGTIHSMANLLEEASDPDVRRVLGDPYSLALERGPDGREQRGVRYSEAAEAWTFPFVMASVNERVVRRSNALLGHLYGAGFRYGESMRAGRGLRGRLRATGLTLGLGAFTAAMSAPRLRKRLLRRLPSPGEGPSRASIERGCFVARLFGRRDGEVVITVEVEGQGDPGYGATACMLGESAVLLSSDEPLGVPGVGTPASAMGAPLIERLNATKVQFRVV